MSFNKEKTYDIGYGKPPAAHRFKPGQSGNPKGRRKRSERLENPSDILLKALKKKVPMSVNGKKVTMSLYEAILQQAVLKAAAGDIKQQKHLIELVEKYVGFATAADREETKRHADEVRRSLLRDMSFNSQPPEYMI